MKRTSERNSNAIERALSLISEAIDILDAHDGPPDAAAHLCIVQERLRQVMREPDG
jgi:hypothetical protein